MVLTFPFSFQLEYFCRDISLPSFRVWLVCGSYWYGSYWKRRITGSFSVFTSFQNSILWWKPIHVFKCHLEFMYLNTFDIFQSTSDIILIDTQNFLPLTCWSLFMLAAKLPCFLIQQGFSGSSCAHMLPQISPGASGFSQLKNSISGAFFWPSVCSLLFSCDF